MNLLINNYCNFKCSYCFAQETMHSDTAKNITMENFEIFLNWLKKNNMREVRLIGGEPTLNPDLEKLLDKIIEYDCFDDILIFSNFSFGPEVADMFVRKSQKIHLSFLPNINSFNLLIPEMKKRILYNLDLLTTAIPDFKCIGVNIYSPDMDLSQWEELICKYNLNRLRFSIVLPNTALPNDFNFYDFFHSYQNLLLKLADLSIKYGVELGCDCNGIPPCCFDPDVVVTLTEVCPEIFGRPFCEVPTLDVTPDLKVNGCFVNGTKENKLVTDFADMYEAQMFYQAEREKNILGVTRKECYSCPRYKKYGQSCSCWIYRRVFND